MIRRLAPALLLTGCTAQPALDLHVLTPELSTAGAIAFRLTDSTIAVGQPLPESGAAPQPPVSLAAKTLTCWLNQGADSCSGAVRAFVAPVEDQAATYAITARQRRFVETRLTPGYAPDSLRLADLAVTVKDHRVEVINAVGTIAAMAAGATNQSGATSEGLASQKAQLNLPLVIDLSDAKLPANGGRCRPAGGAAGPCRPLPGNPDWSYRLSFEDDPAAQGFLPRARLPTLHNVMVASLCRRARLTLDYTPPTVGAPTVPLISLRMTVADPDWLRTSALPGKGRLVFHPLCGMTMERGEGEEIGVDAMATALSNQVQAIRAAR